jgi:hypothetical protein
MISRNRYLELPINNIYNSKSIKLSNNNEISQQKLTILQNKISDNIEWKNPIGVFKDIFYLNRRGMQDIDPIDLKRYFSFLLFCDKSIEEFKELDQNYQSFYVSGLSIDDKNEFDRISKGYYDMIKSKKSSKITDRDLIQMNETVIDNKTRNKYFDKMDNNEIRSILKERIKGLLICSKNEKKNPSLQEFYLQENLIEKSNINKKELDISDLSDMINWSPYEFYADFSEEKLTEIYQAIFNDQEKVKRLATFLPISLFDYTSDTILLNKDRFIYFMKNVGENKQNCQQLVLGFSTELYNDFYKKNKYYQLYSILSFIDDMKTNCHQLCDYTIYLNLFYMFMMSNSKSKIFPIVFKLPKDQYSYNKETNSYSFRTVKPHPPNILFDEYRKFIGIHLFRYYKNGVQKIRCIFTFRNDEYGRDSTVYEEAYSYYSGQELKYFNTDFLLYRLELDEIFGNLGITHQEFYDLFKYYKLTPYIIDNNTTELFATRRKIDDPELQLLIKLLNIKPVKIIKEKIDVKNVSRITIVPYKDDEKINYDVGSFFENKPSLVHYSHRKKIASRRRTIKGGSILKIKKTKKAKNTK